MRAKAFAFIALTAMVASVVIPVTANASFTDSVFLIGKWTHEKTETSGDDTETTTRGFRFDIGGGGRAILEGESEVDGYKSESSSEFEIEWKIEGDILYVYYPSTTVRADPDWDAATQFKLEFDSAFSKLTLYQKSMWSDDFSTDGTEYEKSGSVCGVCCPCAFMYFAVAPLTLFAAFAVRRFRK